MNHFEGLLAGDYGFKPQGKSVPMAASNPSPATPLHELGSRGNARSNKNSNSFIGSFSDDGDSMFVSTNSRKNRNSGGLDDFLDGSGKFKNKLGSHQGDTDFNFDSMFRGSSNTTSAQSMNPPIYDQPVYDDDIFDGVPGLKSSSKVKYDDVFVSSSTQSKRNAAFDDLLGGFGKTESESNTTRGRKIERDEKSISSFDDLLPGFGGSSSPGDRTTSESKWSSEPTVPKTKSKPIEDSFTVSGNFTDPAKEVNKLGSSTSAKINSTKAANSRIFEDVDPFAGLGKPVPVFKSDENNKKKDRSPSRADLSTSGSQSSTNKTTEKTSVRSPERKQNKSVEYDRRSDQTLFDNPASSSDSQKFAPASPPSYASTGSKDTNFQGNASMFVDNLDASDDVWLTVSEIPLFTQPTRGPPPSRPPPPIPGQVPKSGTGPSSFTYSKGKANDHYSFPNSISHFQASKPTTTSVKASDMSPLDEFEDFAMGTNQNNVDEHTNDISNEELEMNSAAAAMKEAMDRAEAKFRYAREVREREGTKTARSKESVQLDKDEKLVQDERARRQERIDRERLKSEREEESEKQRIERERVRAREVEKEREEKEREQRRLEKARELEIEREKARQAVERATREARERAAADARLKAERTAVNKANAEARERAERAAVQRAQAEARERAAADARERAEKAAAEARERKIFEAKEREARERAASARAEAETRARVETAAAAASAKTNQQRNENDFESFFSTGSRASSAPRHRDASSDSFFDPQPQRRYEPGTTKTTSVPTANMRKTSSTTNIVDDLSSIFGAAPSSGDFQEVEGESDERRRARLERQQRTKERAAKALAEKNERDLQIQREQAERHRIAETLDVEIKRWAAGKEGNLRALLSTLQYVLWPECGWQPVSLTDLIIGASVKKVYRKATLCIHPDKVQQKGANLQQKYVAEKVFDILKLKQFATLTVNVMTVRIALPLGGTSLVLLSGNPPPEAWNKFNSEELF